VNDCESEHLCEPAFHTNDAGYPRLCSPGDDHCYSELFCADFASDDLHCGACENECTLLGSFCDDGHCRCPDGDIECDGECREPDYFLDRLADCGGCGRTGIACVDGDPMQVVRMTSRYAHTCVVNDDDHVYCWGDNTHGQVGDGSTDDRASPVLALAFDRVTDVCNGVGHSCALTVNGWVACWGDNENGAIGVGDYDDRSTPAFAISEETAVAVSCGAYHTCALLEGGVMKCWGLHLSGQLGNPSDATTISSPTTVDIEGLGTVRSMAAGGSHTCAIRDGDGSIFCWGSDVDGQLGNGATTGYAVEGITGALAIELGRDHSCALLPFGQVQCWGDNSTGAIGDGMVADAPSPVLIEGLSGPVVQLSLGSGTTCAVRDDGRAQCWGANVSGQLGDQTTNQSSLPVDVLDVAGIAGIGSGDGHTCAFLLDGSARCWGNGTQGELGNGDTTGSLIPVVVRVP
jgi:alpha-tubulin suppressor-like RCC1 family protein